MQTVANTEAVSSPLIKALEQTSVSSTIIKTMKQFYHNLISKVIIQNRFSKCFPVTKGFETSFSNILQDLSCWKTETLKKKQQYTYAFRR